MQQRWAPTTRPCEVPRSRRTAASRVPAAVRQAMLWEKELIGRECDLFLGLGHPHATDVVVVMGSDVQSFEDPIDYSGPLRRSSTRAIRELLTVWSS